MQNVSTGGRMKLFNLQIQILLQFHKGSKLNHSGLADRKQSPICVQCLTQKSSMITLSCCDLNSIGLSPYLTFWEWSNSFLGSPVNSWGLMFSGFLIALGVCCSGFSTVLESCLPQLLFSLLHAKPQVELDCFWISLRLSLQGICMHIRFYWSLTLYEGSNTFWNTKSLRHHSSLFLRALCPSCHRWLLFCTGSYFLPCWQHPFSLEFPTFSGKLVLMQSNWAAFLCGPRPPLGCPEPQ